MSAPVKDGGPAFPPSVCSTASDDVYTSPDGMSLRDWFAGQALLGELASSEQGDAEAVQTPAYSRLIADRAYAYADAMLAARAEAS